MSRCLVTGGAGFIGSHVVDLLVEEGHEVIVIDDLSTGKEENLNPKADLIPQSIADKETWKFIVSLHVGYVFHLAALARIQPSIEQPLASHEVNLTGTLNMLEFARKSKAKVIFSSSSAIYEGDKLPTDESAAKNPKNPYALQKWMGEQYIRLYGYLFGLDYAILRYFNVYGERQLLEGAYAAVVGILLEQKSEGLPLTITNDGEQRRDFTYVKDVALANVMAMGWYGETNIGSGVNYSINELAEMIGGEKMYIGERKGEVQETLANIQRAKGFGWKPTKGIKDFINASISQL